MGVYYSREHFKEIEEIFGKKYNSTVNIDPIDEETGEEQGAKTYDELKRTCTKCGHLNKKID